MELIKEHSIDVCCVTETWLRLKDSAIFAEIHDHGYDVFSAPRRGRGGGVAFLFNPSKLKPVRNTTKTFSSFEVLECLVKSQTQMIRLCVLYRSTRITDKDKYNETKVSKFMVDFDEYLESLLVKTGVPVLCGDFNFHVEDPLDKIAKSFISLYESKGFIQHVQNPTHIAGGTLDLVLTLDNIADSVPVKNLQIEEDTGTASDHFLVHFQLPISISKSSVPQSETKEYRELQKIDIDSLRHDLQVSPLASADLSFLELDEAVKLFNDVLEVTLEKHAPLKSGQFRTDRSPWWNSDCQDARREKRKAKRNIKSDDLESRAHYGEKSIDAAIIINRARDRFYDKKLSSVKGDARGTYKVINTLLDKEYGSRTVPNGVSDEAVANNLMSYFDSKVKNIYNGIKEALPDQPVPTLPCESNVDENCDDSKLLKFETVTQQALAKLIKEMPSKSCQLDPMPMWLFKNCLPELIDIVHHIVNLSLESGVFPSDLKVARIRPGLKKPSLDADELKNYRPISNLTYLSKIVEKIVHAQLTEFTNSYELLSKFQSGYRKGHSCETAVTRIHNDILIMIDKRENVVLLLLDLSAAFDTINHRLLLKKLKTHYGIDGTVLNWLTSYLSERSFRVSVGKSTSSSCWLQIGVPQGSILGPLLFIMYTKDLEDIVRKYGFSIHLYADDTQLYFAFDVHSDQPDLTAINSCFKEIKQWMAINFLKLNDDKTEFIDIGPYQSPIQSLKLDGMDIVPVKKAKNLGFVFDHLMSLDDQVNAVTRTCYLNLRNLMKIGSHLSRALKIQLVHSNILSFVDYCNAVYGSLSESNMKKLQTIQNNAVRFIFNLTGKDRWQSMTPYLKELHFLPVRYRIKYKIALLVFKCLNNLAPRYLSELLSLRETKRRSVRLDDDYYYLKTPKPHQLSRTAGAFYYSGPRVWNELPFSIRCLSVIQDFKTSLKTYLFNTAYNN
jgi:hypothetical protein